MKLKEEVLNDCEGEIIFDEEMGIITINNLITDERQKRFAIAHEMEHFLMKRGEGVIGVDMKNLWQQQKSSKRNSSK